jgi:hypothetical protein
MKYAINGLKVDSARFPVSRHPATATKAPMQAGFGESGVKRYVKDR